MVKETFLSEEDMKPLLDANSIINDNKMQNCYYLNNSSKISNLLLDNENIVSIKCNNETNELVAKSDKINKVDSVEYDMIYYNNIDDLNDKLDIKNLSDIFNKNENGVVIIENCDKDNFDNLEKWEFKKFIIPIQTLTAKLSCFKINHTEIYKKKSCVGYCFVSYEGEVSSILKDVAHNIEIFDYIPLSSKKLDSVLDWRQNLIIEGALSYKAEGIDTNEITKWMSHRALWCHFLSTTYDNCLIILDKDILLEGIPDIENDIDHLQIYSDKQRIYMINREVANQLIKSSRPIMSPFDDFIDRYVKYYSNEKIIHSSYQVSKPTIENASKNNKSNNNIELVIDNTTLEKVKDKIPDSKKLNIAILTIITNNDYIASMQPALDTKKKYCEKHGYTFIVEDNVGNTKSICWLKYKFLQMHLPKYDYIFYSDADVIMLNTDFMLETIINTYFTLDTQLLFSVDSPISSNSNINTSNFIVKNDIDSLLLLDNVFSKQSYNNHTLQDQMALKELYTSDENVKTYVKLISTNNIFNAIYPLPNNPRLEQNYVEDSLLIHFQYWKSPYLNGLHIRHLLSKKNDTPLIVSNSIDNILTFNNDVKSEVGIVSIFRSSKELLENEELIHANFQYCKKNNLSFNILYSESKHPYDMINTYLQENKDSKLVLILNRNSIINHSFNDLENYIISLGKNVNLVTTNNVNKTIKQDEITKLYISLACFIIRNNEWSINLLNEIKESKSPLDKLTDLYNNNTEYSDKIRCLYVNRRLRALLYSDTPEKVVANCYHGQEPIVELSGWDTDNFRWIKKQYLPIITCDSNKIQFSIPTKLKLVNDSIVEDNDNCGLMLNDNDDITEWVNDIFDNIYMIHTKQDGTRILANTSKVKEE